MTQNIASRGAALIPEVTRAIVAWAAPPAGLPALLELCDLLYFIGWCFSGSDLEQCRLVLPGLVAVLTPIAVGVILGPSAEAGLLMVGTMGGIVLATALNNGGGAWDNAKKYIEAGYLRVNAEGEMVDRLDPNGTVLGKKSDPHKAGVVGDTVGDPFKDTAGPSLHVLIKLLSTITLVLAPLYIALHP